ncbi:hypothetical protein LTR37_010404 [Vermiconidia calcicola]|uniref:Uncharacterized protein n=1 Tax=Vermiconidia calcicola TaxID=1690605 RepID=A0ACC3N571_9PEZI|nr:hypothetical protein LTR37_010404 [Vermiconidia calcicola]
MGASKEVIIVGAGPSGLLLALLLAKHGISVTLIEKSSEYDKQPRASFYSYPAQYEFKRAGIMEDVDAKAFHANGVSWRHIDGSLIAQLDTSDSPPDFQMVSLPLDELLPLIGSHLDRQPSAEVLWSHKVLSLGQDEHQAWVEVESPNGTQTLYASYIFGCDGGGSKVRRELFGQNFPGRTWDEQIVATNVYLPNLKKHTPPDWTTSNFMISRDHFPMIAQISNDGLHRVTYGEEGGLTYDELRARQPDKYKAFVPGKPEPEDYKMINFSPYKIHQRLAERLRVGRVLLAADAAHLCNPFGGMGLTGGFADVGGLYDCLYGISSGQCDDSILDKYSDIRREKYQDVIDPISSGNLRRLWDPKAIEDDEFIKMVRRTNTDGEYAGQMREGAKAVMHDFAQYYNKT